MSEWKKATLGDCINIKHGYAFKGEHIIENNNNIVLVTPGNFRIGGGFQEKKCKYFDGDYPKDYVLKPHDFIVTMTDLSKGMDTLGYSAYVPNEKGRIYLHNQRIGLVTIKSNICDKGFLYWLMRNRDYQRFIAGSATGSTVHHTSPSKIYAYKFSYPNILTQKKIAKVLDNYDSLIENYQQQIKLLEEVAQRLYKEWFIDLKFPGHEKVKIVDGVPEGWEKKELGEIVPIITGKKDANFATSDGKYPFFTCAQDISHAPSYSFNGPAVLLAGNGDFNVKIYRGKFEAYQRTYVLIPYEDKNLYLIYHNLVNNISLLATGASGSTIKFLTKRMIEAINVLVPSSNILEKFNVLSSEILRKIEISSRSILLLTEARDRLLPKLMSGEIAV